MPALPGHEPPAACWIVIVSYESADHLRGCVEPWIAAGLAPDHLIVVDNASRDGSADVAQELGCTVLRNPTNQGFGAAANRGLHAAAQRAEKRDWLLVVNPDTRAAGDLRDLIDRLGHLPSQDQVIVPTLAGQDPPGRPNLQPYPWPRATARWLINPKALEEPSDGEAPLAGSYLIGSVLLLRSSTWTAVGYFDERYYLYGEDADLSWRLHRAGLQGTPMEVPLLHLGNEPLLGLPERQQRLMIEGVRLFAARSRSATAGRVVASTMALGCLQRAGFSALRRDHEARSYLRLFRIAVSVALSPERRLHQGASQGEP